MKETNPLFKKEDSPIDALDRICYLLQFIRELQGYNRDELELTIIGKEGFRFFLKILEQSIRQIADAMKGGDSDAKKKKKSG